MKKLISIILSAVMLLSFAVPVFADAEPAPQIRIFIDGSELILGENIPMSESFRTLVPMRALFEKLGAEVIWVSETEPITAKIGSKTVSVRIDVAQIIVDGVAAELEVPARLIGDFTYLPLRAVTEAFGADVQWNEEMQTVTITTAAAEPAASAAPTDEQNPSNSVVPNRRPMSISDGSDVLIKLGDTEITKQDFRYYLVSSNYNIYREFFADNDIATSAELETSFSWDAVYEDGKTYAQISKERALIEAEEAAAAMYLAQQNGISLSAEEVADIESYAAQQKQSLGSDYSNALAASGFSSEEDFIRTLKRVQLVKKFENDFAANKSKYVTSDEALAQYADGEKVSAKHVLIQFEYTDANGNKATRTDAEALAVANEVKAKADAGDDFNALMKQYNEDPGEPDEGYTFGKGEMVAEFESASFALGIGQISQPVKTVYGYHVIKRVAGITEYLKQLRQTLNITVYTDALGSIPVELEAEKPY